MGGVPLLYLSQKAASPVAIPAPQAHTPCHRAKKGSDCMKQGKQLKNAVRVTHKAPGKRGKQETRHFDTPAEALAYIERNTAPREHGKRGRIA